VTLRGYDQGVALELRALVVDWGGVLTGSVDSGVQRFLDDETFDLRAYSQVMGRWFGEIGRIEARLNPIHALERGELSAPDFEERLAREMSEITGVAYDSTGLLERMFRHFDHAHEMYALVRRAHEQGIATGLLSNSWGNEYPREMWSDMFDVVVISGEVGLRKPEPDIFHLTTDRLGLRPEQCVFVDDLRHNVDAAAALGWVGVHHTSYLETAAELEALFGIPLA
jgi:epoxide hydrolase-like predicted phosphatase